MYPNTLEIRNSCAEIGVELIPNEVSNLLEAYDKLKKIVEEAIDNCPDFYNLLCNATEEGKIKDLYKFYQQKVSLKDFNAFIKALKKVCELEGYA